MKIQEILKQPESKSLEFKKGIPKNRQNLLKTVVAFANGAGGNIYVGVDDDRTVTGIKEEPFDLEEKLASIIYDSISPIPNVFFQTIAFEDNVIFIIRILPGANKPFEYLSAGLPLVNSLEGEMAELVDQHGFGLNYLPGDLEGLCTCIVRLASDFSLHNEMSRNASEFFNKYGDADKIYDEYATHIEKIVEHHKKRVHEFHELHEN